MTGYLYILKSLKSDTYYIGSTTDIDRRISQHNSGNVKSTANQRPYALVFTQEFATIEIAQKLERKIKSWKRKDFIDSIVRDGILNLRP